ncbi:hypothetical protein LW893_04215 [Parvimonas micra]|jgi:hypothetical protein|uniref:hypothetical protein n=1 Tax=Parvimonas micra TaxID=33033 RepID=UPI001E345EDA|nr:hypothetical protein [Parvimonas micra]MCE3020142.1 hypothetical protein [Parvimonas micra]
MAKYKIVWETGEEEDEIFDSRQEAKEYAYELQSYQRTGAEILNMSNPGDYEYDEDDFEPMSFTIEKL